MPEKAKSYERVGFFMDDESTRGRPCSQCAIVTKHTVQTWQSSGYIIYHDAKWTCLTCGAVWWSGYELFVLPGQRHIWSRESYAYMRDDKSVEVDLNETP